MSDRTETVQRYRDLCRQADAILRQPDNPCRIARLADGRWTCAYRRVPTSTVWCCRGCRYLGPTGCTVDALHCKLYWCYAHRTAIVGQDPESHPIFVAMAALRDQARTLGVPLGQARQSCADVFGEGAT